MKVKHRGGGREITLKKYGYMAWRRSYSFFDLNKITYYFALDFLMTAQNVYSNNVVLTTVVLIFTIWAVWLDITLNMRRETCHHETVATTCVLIVSTGNRIW